MFAQVSPEHKVRIVRAQRRSGGVAFLGDGVNDALALHAAAVILLEKDLDVLADGVAEGRRIFANTAPQGSTLQHRRSSGVDTVTSPRQRADAESSLRFGSPAPRSPAP